MRESFIHRTFGGHAFGGDPGGYDAARPAYPDWVFDFLCGRCGLAPNAITFKIGAGTGTATRRLLKLAANPLPTVGPDGRLATLLRETIPDKARTVVLVPFEEVSLQEASFDLGLSATAFHWLTKDLALTKVAKLLRPGGWWAMVWNVFGDSRRPDPFPEATKSLLNGTLSPSAGNGEMPFASMPRPGWWGRNGPTHSTTLNAESANGRLFSILIKLLPSTRPIPTSTSTQTVSTCLPHCVILPAMSSTAA